MNQVETTAQRLVQLLLKRRDDRGFTADLRGGLNPDTEHKAWPHVADWCDLTKDRDRTICVTVMGGFAFHPEHASTGNLGVTLRRIALGQRGDDGLPSFEARFRRILACDTVAEVTSQARHVIRAAAAKGVAVNYEALFTDLTYWGDQVKLRWARGYWSGADDENERED